MRILFSSNAFWANTGYAVPVRNLMPRLRALGHEVGNFAWFGLQGGKLNAGGVTVYPAVPDRTEMGFGAGFGANVIEAHAKDFGADLVISVQDIWPLPDDYAERVPCRWMCWFPVDHEPPPPRVVELARTCDVPATYSRWGTELMRRAGVPVRYVPLGVDTRVFRPRDKGEARRALGWPEGRFVAAMVAANKSNPSRKAYPEALMGFARFVEAHAEMNPALYVHCDWTTARGGVSLPKIAKSLGIYERMLFVDRYRYAMGLPEDYLVNVYSAADVLLNPSRTEGFGLPLVEAQACGCPVVTTWFASMPELTVNGVCHVPVQREWTPLGSWDVVPSVYGIAEALGIIAERNRVEREEAAEGGIAVVRREYDWDVTVERYWGPLLGEL